MDDSTPSTEHKPTQRIPLGMSSFGKNEQQQFGQNIRLAMACMEGSAEPVNVKAMPSNATDIRQRLIVLSQDITSSLADQIELLIRFDDLQGWKSSGANHCAAWMNVELGVSLKRGWEYLRIGRKLRLLPTTTALFRAGKLSWSKVRLIANVASIENEKTLCHAALDGSVSEVQRLCNGYRWQEGDKKEGEDNDRAVRQWQSRSFTWQETSIGSTRIQLTLPPDVAQAFLNSVEQSLNRLDNSEKDDRDTSRDASNESNLSQRRADAAVLMAESSLQQAGRNIAAADRYQVIVSVDAADITGPTHKQDTPSKRPTIKGAGPIARETARRIACDCSISTHIKSNGEPMDIGRISRIWPNAMERAIKERDQHCQWPGCTRTQHLPIHHIIHWADGGKTSIDNGVAVCAYHHSLLHEGGYTIERANSSEQLINEQFEQQQHTNVAGLFDFEKDLRNDRESFDKIRNLQPTRYRFIVKNAQGIDIRTLPAASVERDPLGAHAPDASGSPDSYQVLHSARAECAESSPDYHYEITDNQSAINAKLLVPDCRKMYFASNTEHIVSAQCCSPYQ